jgi:hypothetical protein
MRTVFFHSVLRKQCPMNISNSSFFSINLRIFYDNFPATTCQNTANFSQNVLKIKIENRAQTPTAHILIPWSQTRQRFSIWKTIIFIQFIITLTNSLHISKDHAWLSCMVSQMLFTKSTIACSFPHGNDMSLIISAMQELMQGRLNTKVSHSSVMGMSISFVNCTHKSRIICKSIEFFTSSKKTSTNHDHWSSGKRDPVDLGNHFRILRTLISFFVISLRQSSTAYKYSRTCRSLACATISTSSVTTITTALSTQYTLSYGTW